MKKLASLLTLFSLGLFVVGCTDATEEPAPAPGESPSMESGSAELGEPSVIDDLPPVTDDPAPELPAPTEEPAPAEEPTPAEEPAPAEEPTPEEAAAEAADDAAPADDSGDEG